MSSYHKMSQSFSVTGYEFAPYFGGYPQRDVHVARTTTKRGYLPMNSTDALQFIEKSRVVAVLRKIQDDVFEDVIDHLVSGGIRVLEITLDSPGALHVIEMAARRFGSDVLVGGGTILTRQQSRDAMNAGANFLVSPHLDIDLLHYAQELNCPFIPGVLTPSEVQSALRAGAEVVKLFPAATMGPRYIRELRGPFGDLKVMATGGISPDNAHEFIDAGAWAVGMGSALFPRADVESRDWKAVHDRALRITESIRS